MKKLSDEAMVKILYKINELPLVDKKLLWEVYSMLVLTIETAREMGRFSVRFDGHWLQTGEDVIIEFNDDDFINV